MTKTPHGRRAHGDTQHLSVLGITRLEPVCTTTLCPGADHD
ncbi:hypothetical protein IQ22_00973 [Pseudomonas duriflava]|uniref:Uncharacterized protein n=1 Tax=Pseudomonas duriflava TaxID=459528 RepID=A0A562QIL9_9PSED|nr:hypothetical protein [Pseudomonas duriflava]TWI56523.1 hypothetical protein IQ22_00973 [Pseudomonas duriflava]